MRRKRKTDFLFKGAIVGEFGSQSEGAVAMRIEESRLSRIIRGYREPSEKEFAIFQRILGPDAVSGLSERIRATRGRAKK